MPFPGKQKWATNDDWSSGTQQDKRTKSLISEGQKREGFKRNMVVHPQIWNGWRNQVTDLLSNMSFGVYSSLMNNPTDYDAAAGLGYTLSFATADVYDLNSVIEGHCFGIADPNDIYRRHTCVVTDSTETTLKSFLELQALGGHYFTCPTSPTDMIKLAGAGGDDQVNGIGIDPSSNRVIACSDGAAGAYGLYHSASYGAFAGWSVGTTTVNKDFRKVLHDQSSIWVAVEDTAGTFDIQTAAAVNNTLTSRAVTAAYTTNECCLAFSNHAANDLFYGDAANYFWMFLEATSGGLAYYSSDGTTWASLTTAGETVSPHGNDSLAYSKWGERWGLVNTSSTSTTNPTFIYSDDNGSNWSEVVDAFEFDSDGNIVSVQDFHLACDGYGSWMATCVVNTDAANYETRIYLSVDNGLTWRRILAPYVNERSSTSTLVNAPFLSELTNCMGTALWYGDGAFNFMEIGFHVSSAATYKKHISSLRVY